MLLCFLKKHNIFWNLAKISHAQNNGLSPHLWCLGAAVRISPPQPLSWVTQAMEKSNLLTPDPRLPAPWTMRPYFAKSRDITLPTKVCLVKAMVFPVVMYGCESWTLKSLLQHHNAKASILQYSSFFMVQLWHPYMTTGKTDRKSVV